MIKIINEGIFSAIADSLGMGNLWEVFKGRFLQAFRGWVAITDIWKAGTEKEIEEAMTDYRSDLEEIKGRYRAAESEFAEKNSDFTGAYGDHMIFMNPALTMSKALMAPLMDENYRKDTRALMAYSGIERFGLTPKFISDYIKDDPNKETFKVRSTTTDKEGKKKETQFFVYEPKNKNDKVSQIMSLFLAENVEKKQPSSKQSFSKDDAKKMAVNISKAYESEGVFDEMKKVAENILESKKNLIAEVVVPSAQTIKLLSDLISSATPEDFTQIMSQISQINPKMKDLNPGNFVSEIDNTVSQIKSDKATFEKISKDLNLSEEMSDNQLRVIIYEVARNKFAQSILESLETIYEKTIEALMEGITEKGLKIAKRTKIGKEYAELIENNIQILEQAILSLERISQ